MCFCSLLLLCNIRPPSLWLCCNLCLEGLDSALPHPSSFSRLTWMSFKTQLRYAHLQNTFPDFPGWLNGRLPTAIHSPISKSTTSPLTHMVVKAISSSMQHCCSLGATN